MNMRNLTAPTLPGVLLGGLGVFHVAAAIGTVVPSFVHDRYPKQFVPVWEFFLGPAAGEGESMLVTFMARLSQGVIGLSELAIGAALLASAAAKPGSPRRRSLASFGLAFSIGLFSAFMITMFIMHDPNLPRWNQYPAMLAMLGAAWMVVALTDARTDTPAP